jgi:ferredoxin-NADP reductase
MELTEACITTIQQATPSIKAFSLSVDPAHFRFLPGQWIDLYLPDSAPDTGGARIGGYSMTTSPLHRDSIGLAIKTSSAHPVTRWLHEQAQTGMRVRISQGQGPFVYVPEIGDDVVLIGGGVGVTPLLSIFRHIDEARLPTRASLLYSTSDAAEILFREELEQRAQANPRLRFLPTVSRAEPGWGGLTGRIDNNKLAPLASGNHTLFYLCGPPGMVEEVSALLNTLGVPASRIIFEKWW